MEVLVLILYLALVVMWLVFAASIVASPFVLLWLVGVALVGRLRRRRAQSFPWRPRDWGAEPLHLPELRASTRERDRTAADLVRHWHEGRLTVEELDERVGKALEARTRGELELLRADLP